MRWIWFVFPCWLTVLSIFLFICWPPAFPLWKYVYSDLLPIFSLVACLVLSCLSWLHILDINTLAVTSFANIFSRLIGCLFLLSVVSFAVQKLTSLIRYNLFIFAFIYFALEDRFKKNMSKSLTYKEFGYNLCQRMFCLCFPLGVFWFLILHLGL